MNAIEEIPLLLGNDAATLDEEGWALIAPFGEHPKTRVVRTTAARRGAIHPGAG